MLMKKVFEKKKVENLCPWECELWVVTTLYTVARAGWSEPSPVEVKRVKIEENCSAHCTGDTLCPITKSGCKCSGERRVGKVSFFQFRWQSHSMWNPFMFSIVPRDRRERKIIFFFLLVDVARNSEWVSVKTENWNDNRKKSFCSSSCSCSSLAAMRCKVTQSKVLQNAFPTTSIL